MENTRIVNDNSVIETEENKEESPKIDIPEEEPLYRISDITKLMDEKIKAEQQKTAEVMDKYLRINADFDNYKKATAKTIATSAEAGKIKIISDILPVLDDFEKAIEHNDLTEGNMLIYNKLLNVLSVNGVDVINPDEFDTFDTAYHNAISGVPNEELTGLIVKTIRKGYKMNNTVIRYADVVVYN